MDWLTLHGKALAGALLLLAGLVAMVYPKALIPQGRMEKLRKIHLPQEFPQRKQPEKSEKFPLALSIFLRVSGAMFVIAGAVILLAQH
jgi:hypothetical protein